MGSSASVVRDSKIEKINPDNTVRTGEVFQLVQPMTVHAGRMPDDLLGVEAGPWNNRGRRSFSFLGSRKGKPISMEQAIIEIAPHITRYRGVDGFWQGQINTNQVPRPVITSLLGRVEQQNAAERERGRSIPDGRRLVSRGEEGARFVDQGFSQVRGI